MIPNGKYAIESITINKIHKINIMFIYGIIPPINPITVDTIDHMILNIL